MRADAVILDLDLPDVGGMEVLNSIRGWTAVPVIALSTRTAEIQKVAALDAGADDYITKPFDTDELMAPAARYSAWSAVRLTRTRHHDGALHH